MMIRFLKILAAGLAFFLIAQGCALVISDDDDFHGHHGYWRHHERGGWEHSSLEQKSQPENTKG